MKKNKLGDEYYEILHEELKQKCYQDFTAFFKFSWDLIDPEPFSDNWHIDLLCEHAQAFYQNQLNTNIMVVTIPPRCSKSKIFSVCLPAWIWLQDPGMKFIQATHTEVLYTQNITETRLLIETDWYSNNWCNPRNKADYRFTIRKDSNTKNRLDLYQGGQLLGVSPKSKRDLGFGGNFIIVDDIVAASDLANVKNSVNFYQTVLRNRLNNKKTGKILVVAQRVDLNDLPGFIIENDPSAFLLRLPMDFDPTLTFVSPIGINDPRKPGEVLDPVRFPESYLRTERQDPLYYAARYQQDPCSHADSLYRPEYAYYYAPSEIDPAWPIYSVWDLSYTDGPYSDFTAGLVFRLDPATRNVYAIDLFHEKTNILGQLLAIKTAFNKYPDMAKVFVEDRANGQALYNLMEDQIGSLVPVELLNNKRFSGSKALRFSSSITYHASGKFRLPDERPNWVGKILKELTSFPSGKDDITDVVTYAILWANLNKVPPAPLSSLQLGSNSVRGHSNPDDPNLLPNNHRQITVQSILADLPVYERGSITKWFT